MEYSLHLEKYRGPSTRYACPQCGAKKRFTRYVYANGRHIADHVGFCSRINSCKYHVTPKEYFKEAGITYKRENQPRIDKTEIKTSISYIPLPVVYSHLKGVKQSYFYQYLVSKFDREIVNRVVQDYLIGTSLRFGGRSTVFFQLDPLGKCRTGKIMQYDRNTGKRIKKPYSQISWIHSCMEDYILAQCLYGLHLLRSDRFEEKVIGITESEKSAIIMAIVYPQMIWMAVGGISNLKKEKLMPLVGRKICLFPDIGAYDKWCYKAEELSEIIPDIIVSDLLEVQAKRRKGADLIDFLE